MTGPSPSAEAGPGSAPPRDQASDRAQLIRVTRVAVAVAALLALTKATAWMVTGSVSLAASMMDSFLDVLASGLNLWAIRVSLTPPDAEHRFGHGKAEPLAGLAQAAFIVGSALFLSFESIERLVNPVQVSHGPVGVAVLGGAIVATLWLVRYQRRVARSTGSTAVAADALHYAADVLTNIAAIAGLLLASELGWRWADPVFAILVAGILVHAASGIVREAIHQLMDHELPLDDRAWIQATALGEPLVRDCHDLKTRASGRDVFIQLHLSFDGDLRVVDAHDAGERVAQQVRSRFPEAEVLVHHDPLPAAGGLKEDM